MDFLPPFRRSARTWTLVSFVPSIRLIAQEFGFDLDHPIDRHTWVEELAPGHHAASILEMHIGMPRSAA